MLGKIQGVGEVTAMVESWMNIISRYISKTIITAILIISLILVGIELLISFIGQLGDIGKGHYGAWNAVKFVFLDMPYQFNTLFPMASLVGSLLGLGVLASQSELIVMRAAGFSTGQICLAVLKAALLMVIFSMILGEVVAPYTEGIANVNKAIAVSAGKALHPGQAVWLREGNHYIHIDRVVTNKHLKGVTSYAFNPQHQLRSALFAKQADYVSGAWQLQGVRISDFYPKHIHTQKIKAMRWNLQFSPQVLSIAATKPQNMSMLKLHHYIQYLKSNGLQVQNYQLTFWKRIIQPLATAVMIFLAVPFVFGPLRSVTMGLRILAGVTFGFGFYILNEFFGPLSILYQIPPLLGAILPTTVFILIGFGLMLRVG